jgi:AcrR family transcriptional regulator
MANVKEKRFQKRKIIIDKVMTLMEKVGFEKITVRMICEVAGISAGTFYHYFHNKLELLIELFSLIDKYFEENVLLKLNDEYELVNIIKFCEGFAEYATLIGYEKCKIINSTFPIVRKENYYEEQNRILYSELNKIIKRGQEKGQITMEYASDKLVNNIIIIIRGYCFDWARREGHYDLKEYINNFMIIFIKSIMVSNENGLGNEYDLYPYIK